MNFQECLKQVFEQTAAETQPEGEAAKDALARRLKLRGKYRARLDFLYKHAFAENAPIIGDAAADKKAGQIAVARFLTENAKRRRRAGLAAQKLIQIRNRLGERGLKTLIGLFHHTEAVAPTGHISYDTLRKTLRSRAIGALHERVIIPLRHSQILGETRNTKLAADFARYLHGDELDPKLMGELEKMAKPYREIMEWLRTRWNAAGGAIGKLVNRGLPHNHNRNAVFNAGLDEWRDFIRPLLDRRRMLSHSTGAPLNDIEFEALLAQVWENIIDARYSDEAHAGFQSGQKITGSLELHRKLHFTSGEGWLQYHERFGQGEIYDLIVNEIDALTRGIALMETFGPDPARTFRALPKLIDDWAGGRGETEVTAARKTKRTVANYTRFIEEGHQVYRQWLASIGQAIRGWMVSANLGAASMTALNDAGFMRSGFALAGIPVTRQLDAMLKAFDPSNALDRQIAESQLAILYDAQHLNSQAHWRFSPAEGEPNEILSSDPKTAFLQRMGRWGSKAGNATIVAGGLDWITARGRRAVFLAFNQEAMFHQGKAFGDLPDKWRGFLRRYGITPGEWKHLAEAGSQRVGDASVFNLGAVPEPVRDKWLAAVLTEVEHGVVTDTFQQQSWLSDNLNPGTLGGEAARTILQFKTFAMAAWILHAGRAASLPYAHLAAGYLGGLAISTSILSVGIIQLKHIKDGRDPEPMDPRENPSLYVRALFHGGGLGIVGDLINSGIVTTRSVGDLVVGPAFGAADTLKRAGHSAAKTAAAEIAGGYSDKRDADRHRGATARRLFELVPGGNLWYLDTLLKRQMEQNVIYWASSGEYDHRQVRGRAEKRGAPHWWDPDEMWPDRAPDLANALEGEIPE